MSCKTIVRDILNLPDSAEIWKGRNNFYAFIYIKDEIKEVVNASSLERLNELINEIS